MPSLSLALGLVPLQTPSTPGGPAAVPEGAGTLDGAAPGTGGDAFADVLKKQISDLKKDSQAIVKKESDSASADASGSPDPALVANASAPTPVPDPTVAPSVDPPPDDAMPHALPAVIASPIPQGAGAEAAADGKNLPPGRQSPPPVPPPALAAGMAPRLPGEGGWALALGQLRRGEADGLTPGATSDPAGLALPVDAVTASGPPPEVVSPAGSATPAAEPPVAAAAAPRFAAPPQDIGNRSGVPAPRVDAAPVSMASVAVQVAGAPGQDAGDSTQTALPPGRVGPGASSNRTPPGLAATIAEIVKSSGTPAQTAIDPGPVQIVQNGLAATESAPPPGTGYRLGNAQGDDAMSSAPSSPRSTVLTVPAPTPGLPAVQAGESVPRDGSGLMAASGPAGAASQAAGSPATQPAGLAMAPAADQPIGSATRAQAGDGTGRAMDPQALRGHLQPAAPSTSAAASAGGALPAAVTVAADASQPAAPASVDGLQRATGAGSATEADTAIQGQAQLRGQTRLEGQARLQDQAQLQSRPDSQSQPSAPALPGAAPLADRPVADGGAAPATGARRVTPDTAVPNHGGSERGVRGDVALDTHAARIRESAPSPGVTAAIAGEFGVGPAAPLAEDRLPVSGPRGQRASAVTDTPVQFPTDADGEIAVANAITTGGAQDLQAPAAEGRVPHAGSEPLAVEVRTVQPAHPAQAGAVSSASGRAETVAGTPMPSFAGPLLPFSAAAGPDLGDDLGQRILWLAGNRLRGAEIQLDPPELGPLQVQVQAHRDGASVHFVTHTAAARDAVEASLPRLRDMLESSGLNLLDVNVAQQQERGGRGAGEAQTGYASTVAPGGADPGAEAVSAVPRARPAQGLVDAYA